MLRIILISILCLLTCVINAQLSTGERPPGLEMLKNDRSIAVQTLPVPDINKIKAEDAGEDLQSGPVSFAYGIRVNYTPYNSGSWHTMDDGSKLWRLKVKLPGALSSNTYYDKLWIPDGTKFFLYNDETQQHIGAITSEFLKGNSKEPKKFATSLIYGETVTFEYWQPAFITDSAIISISRIDYGYRNINNPYDTGAKGLFGSLECNNCINDPVGADWQNEKDAIARITFPVGGKSRFATGALINNTSNEFIPYFLTANHALLIAGLDALGDTDASQWVFHWKYEFYFCYPTDYDPLIYQPQGQL